MLNVGLFVLRVFVGLQLAAHGSQKLFGLFKGPGPAGMGAFLEQLGFRPGKHHAVAAGLGEFVGGLLLALGLLTPLGSAAIIAVMLTAMFTVHVEKGFFAQDGGFELPLLIAVAAAALSLTGPGSASLDRAIGWNLQAPFFAYGGIVLGVLGACAALAERSASQHHHRGEQRATVG